MAVDTYFFIDGEYLGEIHLEAMLGFFGPLLLALSNSMLAATLLTP
jgi:hypothetical protein